MRDLKSEIGIVHLLDPADVTNTDTKTKLLDLQGFQSAVLTAIVGAITTPDSNSYLEIVAQESDTTADADFTTVAAADLIGAFTKIDATTEDQVTQSVGYRGNKRYIRLLFNFTDGDAGISHALISSVGIVSHANTKPVTAPAAVTAT